MKLFRRRPVETRESYADAVIARIMASASAASDGSSLAVVETAARLWSAGLSSATVSPVSGALSAVTSTFLAGVGRSLCNTGESLHLIVVSEGRGVADAGRFMECAWQRRSVHLVISLHHERPDVDQDIDIGCREPPSHRVRTMPHFTMARTSSS